jgi:DNA-binding NarL/FixJ family response regulator
MPEVKVVGHAVSEARAIERIDELLPDAVILDLGLQSGSGIGVLESVKKHHAEIKVMVFTHYTDEFYVDRCKRAGADYFFDKTNQLMQLRDVLLEWAYPDRFDNKFNTLQIAGGLPVTCRSTSSVVENS